MRKPKIKNKYNLKPKDIQKATILDRSKLEQKPFWRNNAINAWCLSGGTGKGIYDSPINEYWIAFYDEDAKSYAGKIRLSLSCWEGMGKYKLNSFFNPKDIKNIADLEIQEMLLERINWLIDNQIIAINR